MNFAPSALLAGIPKNKVAEVMKVVRANFVKQKAVFVRTNMPFRLEENNLILMESYAEDTNVV